MNSHYLHEQQEEGAHDVPGDGDDAPHHVLGRGVPQFHGQLEEERRDGVVEGTAQDGTGVHLPCGP